MCEHRAGGTALAGRCAAADALGCPCGVRRGEPLGIGEEFV